MKTPHKHADLIKAWADGAEIEYFCDDQWVTISSPIWDRAAQFRIKPEPKPDLNYYYHIDNEKHVMTVPTTAHRLNLKLTFDGETRKLKSAEVIA